VSETDGTLLAGRRNTPVSPVAFVALAAFDWLGPILAEVLPRVARIAVFIALGVFLANLAVAFGLVERIAGLSRYLTGPANLPDEVGTAILTTTASTTAGYGMLAEFRESGTLDDRATLVAVTINTFFGFVQHVFTFYVPVIIPILGLETGLLAGALLLSGRNVDAGATVAADPPEDEYPTVRAKLERAWNRTRPKLVTIVPRLAIIYTLVTVLVRQYDLTAITGAADPLAQLVGLPVAAIPVVVVFSLDTTSGAATIAPLIGETFTPQQAVATLLIGGVVSFTVSTFKRSIPFQYGIWGPSFGSKVVAVNTGLKLVFVSLAAVAVLAI
jgi:hypothetical protein